MGDWRTSERNAKARALMTGAMRNSQRMKACFARTFVADRILHARALKGSHEKAPTGESHEWQVSCAKDDASGVVTVQYTDVCANQSRGTSRG
jgi:hypothetical protein